MPRTTRPTARALPRPTLSAGARTALWTAAGLIALVLTSRVASAQAAPTPLKLAIGIVRLADGTQSLTLTGSHFTPLGEVILIGSPPPNTSVSLRFGPVAADDFGFPVVFAELMNVGISHIGPPEGISSSGDYTA